MMPGDQVWLWSEGAKYPITDRLYQMSALASGPAYFFWMIEHFAIYKSQQGDGNGV